MEREIVMTGVGGQGMLADDEVVSPPIVPRIWGVSAEYVAAAGACVAAWA
jgi:hypothetical protein